MADTLKEFSSFTGKSYSDLKDGITIASTNGSQKAVIKQISIDNPNGRNIQIREGSITGPIVAQTTADGLNGNEILDNSQSLVATTDEKPPVTAIHQVGWFEGGDSNQHNTTGHIRTWGTKGHKYPDYSWTYNDLDWGPTNNQSHGSNNDDAYGRRPFNSATTSTNLQNVSDSWFGADGRFYWVHRQSAGGEISGTMFSNFTVRRFETDSSTVTTYGSTGDAKISAYDGERYFYTIASGSSEMRKYDTKTLGTSNTYTAITLRPDDKDTGTQTITLDDYVCGYYYCDGYILINGNNSNDENDSGAFRLISCATGKTKACYSPAWDNLTGYGSGTTQSTHRASIGLVKDSQGCFWTFIGRYANDNYNDENRIYISSIGTNPEKTFLANGQKWGRRKAWYLANNNSTSHKLQTIEGDQAKNIVRKLGVQGNKFGNPAGTAVHSPSMSRYLLLVGDHYKDGTACPSNDRGPYFVAFDFDCWNSRQAFVPDRFRGNDMRYNGGPNNEARYHAGVYRMVTEPEAVDGSFGDISIRTSGILVT